MVTGAWRRRRAERSAGAASRSLNGSTAWSSRTGELTEEVRALRNELARASRASTATACRPMTAGRRRPHRARTSPNEDGRPGAPPGRAGADQGGIVAAHSRCASPAWRCSTLSELAAERRPRRAGAGSGIGQRADAAEPRCARRFWAWTFAARKSLAAEKFTASSIWISSAARASLMTACFACARPGSRSIGRIPASCSARTSR